jgi:hypothetical protein
MEQCPLTAGEHVVSGSLSSPSRGTFHLSLTVLVHYRLRLVFSLGGWSPRFPTRFHESRGTQDPNDSYLTFVYGTLTRSGRAFQLLQLARYSPDVGPTTPVILLWPVWALPASLATTTGISVDFFSSSY